MTKSKQGWIAKPSLLGWIRKIADNMFPQVTRGDYSRGEVENLLIAVGVKHEELLKAERQRVVEMIYEVMGVERNSRNQTLYDLLCKIKEDK